MLVLVDVVVKGKGAVRRTVNGLYGDVEQGGEEKGRADNVRVVVGGDGVALLGLVQEGARPTFRGIIGCAFADALGGKKDACLILFGNTEGDKQAYHKTNADGFQEEAAVLPS